MHINLDMLSPLVLHRVGGEVDCTHIVAVDQGGLGRRRVKLMEELVEPGDFGDRVDDGSVFGLSTGAGDRDLVLGGPGHQVVA